MFPTQLEISMVEFRQGHLGWEAILMERWIN